MVHDAWCPAAPWYNLSKPFSALFAQQLTNMLSSRNANTLLFVALACLFVCLKQLVSLSIIGAWPPLCAIFVFFCCFTLFMNTNSRPIINAQMMGVRCRSTTFSKPVPLLQNFSHLRYCCCSNMYDPRFRCPLSKASYASISPKLTIEDSTALEPP